MLSVQSVIVYRIEHREYINPHSNHFDGPYNRRYALFCEETNNAMQSVPVPSQWFNFRDEHVFGCLSLACLWRLFSTCFEEMYRHDYVVREYDVPAEFVEFSPSGEQLSFLGAAGCIVKTYETFDEVLTAVNRSTIWLKAA